MDPMLADRRGPSPPLRKHLVEQGAELVEALLAEALAWHVPRHRPPDIIEAHRVDHEEVPGAFAALLPGRLAHVAERADRAGSARARSAASVACRSRCAVSRRPSYPAPSEERHISVSTSCPVVPVDEPRGA